MLFDTEQAAEERKNALEETCKKAEESAAVVGITARETAGLLAALTGSTLTTGLSACAGAGTCGCRTAGGGRTCREAIRAAAAECWRSEDHIACAAGSCVLRSINSVSAAVFDADRAACRNKIAAGTSAVKAAEARTGTAAEGNIGTLIALLHHGVTDREHRRAAERAAVFGVDRVAVTL